MYGIIKSCGGDSLSLFVLYKLRSMNKQFRATAIRSFALFLKKVSSRHRGWAVKRIESYVRENIKTMGFHASPQWFLQEFPDIIWDDGGLKVWSPRGYYVSFEF